MLGVVVGPRSDTLGGAVDYIAVLNKSLDHPMASAGAMDPSIDAGWAKIIVSVIADAAVEVLIFHGLTAVVAKDHPAALWVLLRAEGQVGILGNIRKAIEEAYPLLVRFGNEKVAVAYSDAQ